MDKQSINYGEIDEGIRDLVQKLNDIPFVATQSSCEGHIRPSMADIFPDEGHALLDGGHIIFRVDRRYKGGRHFLEEMARLPETYPFVALHVHHCKEFPCEIEGSHSISLGCEDLTDSEAFQGDTLEAHIKRRFQVPTQQGYQRLQEFRGVWANVLTIAERYVRNRAT
ncbi:hypothetical protein HYS48_03440 [Candidatus Woesearchaeota archaeon]|nr:hypothetical protein [Candidatus Woesearchaeota archaeon]